MEGEYEKRALELLGLEKKSKSSAYYGASSDATKKKGPRKIVITACILVVLFGLYLVSKNTTYSTATVEDKESTE